MLPTLRRDTSIHHISRVKEALASEHNKEIKSMPMVVGKLRTTLPPSNDNDVHADVIMAQNILVMHLSVGLHSVPLKTLHQIEFSLDIVKVEIHNANPENLLILDAAGDRRRTRLTPIRE